MSSARPRSYLHVKSSHGASTVSHHARHCCGDVTMAGRRWGRGCSFFRVSYHCPTMWLAGCPTLPARRSMQRALSPHLRPDQHRRQSLRSTATSLMHHSRLPYSLRSSTSSRRHSKRLTTCSHLPVLFSSLITPLTSSYSPSHLAEQPYSSHYPAAAAPLPHPPAAPSSQQWQSTLPNYHSMPSSSFPSSPSP